MTRETVAAMLDSAGIPVAYYAFPEQCGIQPPFMVFYYGYNPVRADNKAYVGVTPLTVELYTENKDFTLESTIESILEAGALSFDKAETYIESEQMFEIIYNTEVIIDG